MTRLAATLRGRLRASDALHASANALIVSTAVTSVAGLGFWALAARWLPADAVGIGTALVSVLTLLANLATLGLRNGLVRFLPSAGASTRRLIAGSSLACALAAVILSGVFLVGQPWWAGRLGFLRDDVLTIGVFTAATVVWVLFVLQDHVLIGLRKSIWVPAKNLAYSIGKIALLPVLTAAATWAVFAATVLPAVLAVAGVSLLVRRLTRSAGVGPVPETPISIRHLVRFAAADQVAWLVWVATPHVLTLIVLHVQGPEASAYYYIANMIGYSLYLVTSNIGSALIAESVHDPVHAASHARSALTHSVRLVFPLAAVGVVLGPYALRILGADYAIHASTAMQLIILSALPQTIVGISVNTARVRREMSTVVGTYVFLAVAIWGGSWITLRWWGVTGVGATILVSQSLAALGLVLSGRTGLAPGPAVGRGAHWRTRPQVGPQLDRLPVAAARRETVGGEDSPEQRPGRPVTMFAHPPDPHTRTIEESAADAGSTSATAVRTLLGHERDDGYAGARLAVTDAMAGTEPMTGTDAGRLLQGHGARRAPLREPWRTWVGRQLRRLRHRSGGAR